MKEFIHTNNGTCSRRVKIVYDETTHIVDEISFEGGCPGNTFGVATLCKGKSLEEIVKLLKGIKCGFKKTSCPDQLAEACEQILGE